ncbi:hypothetical protein BN961_02132 [Afipia felis]|uniref:DUF3040 domain-containing protein n=1 Tax=Afipia felis TaxID=1035 RepID=A0A090MSW2_AFIFE|nr:hypothetical protein BN961_02132 [Afipia felis]
MSDPLTRHDLKSLENAQVELGRHIRARRRRHRPSKIRRLVGLLFSVPAVIAGSALLMWSIKTDHLLGYPAMIGPALLVGGAMWIYCDWLE